MGKYVMSEVQTLLSSPRSNRRLTRSLGRCASRSTTVVTEVNFRGLIPARRWRRIEAATVLQKITSPSSRRSARMCGAESSMRRWVAAHFDRGIGATVGDGAAWSV